MGLKIDALIGSANRDSFGYAVAIGDLNGDDRNEIIIGATGIKGGVITIYNSNQRPIKRLYIGKKKINTIRLLVVDINKDSINELIVAVTYQDLTGEVKVYSLKKNKVIYRWKSQKKYDAFGFQIASGDVNGDGVPDVIISAPQPVKEGKGSVYLFSGKDGALIRDFTSKVPKEYSDFGTSVTSADINNDGIDEVIIGSPGKPNGEVYIYSGLHGWLMHKITGDHPGFGIMVHANRLREDENHKLFVTTKDISGNMVSIYESHPFKLTHLYDIEDDDVDTGFGEILTTGDINGDGKKELIIGAFDSHQGRRKLTGRVNVFEVDERKQLHKWYGKMEKDQFGFSLATGKINSDNRDAILIGSPREILGKKGLVYIATIKE